MMSRFEVPLFPLSTVLFPDGHLPLRIFEQRYLDMVTDCARNDCEFGVCLIVKGDETHPDVRTAQVGTFARIVDWYTLEDGLLGLSTTGTHRFSLEQTRQQTNGLILGDVVVFPDPSPCRVPESYFVLSQVLGRFLDKMGDKQGELYPDYTPDHLDDAHWLGYRLSELLPISVMEKQNLLEFTDPIDRLQCLLETLPRFQSEA